MPAKRKRKRGQSDMEMYEEERVTFGLPDIGIPAEVLFHPELTVNDKLLFGFIRNLSQSSKGCWATNKYLGAFLGLKKQTVSKAVSKLEKCRYINVYFETARDNRTIRRIFVNPDINKIYQKMVEKIHDQIEKGEAPHMTQNIWGYMTHVIGGYDTDLNEYVNEDVNEVVMDNSRELSNAIFEKSRRRKHKKSSMKDKVKEKASKKAKKKKSPDTIQFDTVFNNQMLQVWNKQENLRSHNNKNTQTCKSAFKKLELLRRGKLHQIIPKDEFPDKIPEEWFTTTWKKSDIKHAIEVLNERCKEGVYPVKKDWIKKLSLADAIYNSRYGSPLMDAFRLGVVPIYDPSKDLKTEHEKQAFNKFFEFFSGTLNKSDVKTQQQIVTLVKNLKGQREAHKHNWNRYDPEHFGCGAQTDPATLLILAIDYRDFLMGKFGTDFKAAKSLTPMGLKIGSWPFEQFKKAFHEKYGADVIEGP